MLGAEWIGDLVQITEAELLRLPNTGRKTVSEIKDTLGRYGFRLGMHLPEWKHIDPARERSLVPNGIRFALSRLEAKTGESGAVTLQEEAHNVVSKVEQGRNLKLVLTLWGMDGTPRKTLEEVGQTHAMTRERVRQIEAKTIRNLQARWHELPLLDAALSALERCGPLVADDVATVLKENSVPAEAISASAILKAAEVFERRSAVAISSISSRPVVARPEVLELVRRATLELRRTTQSSGCTSLTLLQFGLSGNILISSDLRQGLEMVEEVVWLDAERTWLYSKRPVRNRLFNLVEKIFTVATRVHVNELRQAVSRPHRVKYVPPADVLSAFCTAHGLLKTSENEIVSAPALNADLGDLDGAFVRAFQSLGSPLTREELEDYCIEEEGMKVSSFFQRLSYCPLFLRLASGVYALVGTRVPAGSVEAAKRRIRDDRTPPQHGWSPDGRLWVVVRLSRASIQSGAFFAPSFVNEHAEGIWRTTLTDGREIGTVEVKQGIVNGLRDEFELLAADASDFCLLKFDLTNNKVSVQVGGPDLQDQATELGGANEETELDDFEESYTEDGDRSI